MLCKTATEHDQWILTQTCLQCQVQWQGRLYFHLVSHYSIITAGNEQDIMRAGRLLNTKSNIHDASRTRIKFNACTGWVAIEF
jgi:hypothetical protein